MRLTLKQVTINPSAEIHLQQQDKFADFIYECNNKRPHKALNRKRPVDACIPSTRTYEGLPDVSYPFHDETLTITQCGRICVEGQKVDLSTVFAGHDL